MLKKYKYDITFAGLYDNNNNDNDKHNICMPENYNQMKFINSWIIDAAVYSCFYTKKHLQSLTKAK